MKLDPRPSASQARSGPRKQPLAVLMLLALGMPAPAHASIFEGETLDKVATILAWIVLIIVPIVGIVALYLALGGGFGPMLETTRAPG